MFSPTIIIFVYGVCARDIAAAPWSVDEYTDGLNFVGDDSDSQERDTRLHCAAQDSNMVADGSVLEPPSPDSRQVDFDSTISMSCLAVTTALSMLSVAECDVAHNAIAGLNAVSCDTDPVPPSKRELDSPRSHWDPNADSTATFILRTRARVRGGVTDANERKPIDWRTIIYHILDLDDVKIVLNSETDFVDLNR